MQPAAQVLCLEVAPLPGDQDGQATVVVDDLPLRDRYQVHDAVEDPWLHRDATAIHLHKGERVLLAALQGIDPGKGPTAGTWPWRREPHAVAELVSVDCYGELGDVVVQIFGFVLFLC